MDELNFFFYWRCEYHLKDLNAEEFRSSGTSRSRSFLLCDVKELSNECTTSVAMITQPLKSPRMCIWRLFFEGVQGTWAKMSSQDRSNHQLVCVNILAGNKPKSNGRWATLVLAGAHL